MVTKRDRLRNLVAVMIFVFSVLVLGILIGQRSTVKKHDLEIAVKELTIKLDEANAKVTTLAVCILNGGLPQSTSCRNLATAITRPEVRIVREPGGSTTIYIPSTSPRSTPSPTPIPPRSTPSPRPKPTPSPCSPACPPTPPPVATPSLPKP